MSERRRGSRSFLPRELTVLESEKREVLGELVDLSCDGLRVRGPRPMPRGEEVDISIRLPGGWAELREIDFTAQCRWQTPCDPGRGYDLGLQIVDISDTEAFLIREILDLYGNLSAGGGPV